MTNSSMYSTSSTHPSSSIQVYRLTNLVMCLCCCSIQLWCGSWISWTSDSRFGTVVEASMLYLALLKDPSFKGNSSFLQSDLPSLKWILPDSNVQTHAADWSHERPTICVVAFAIFQDKLLPLEWVIHLSLAHYDCGRQRPLSSLA